jgi:N6-L-threonylcarbamoyladenine synthase
MEKNSVLLGIESSCDECSASVVRLDQAKDGNPRVEVLGLATYSQISIHQPYGGVVPEIASRNHLETINAMIREATQQAVGVSIDAIAVTNRPGLVGALLVGVSAAKALAYAKDLPLVPVHHLEGHAASLYLAEPGTQNRFDDNDMQTELPLLLAIVSGGHTNLHIIRNSPLQWPPGFLSQSRIGRSIDDAAGEAFDKTAKILGFPYPGGVWIDRTARERLGNPGAFDLPRALPQKENFDFSFSGLKTAVSLKAEQLKKSNQLEERLGDLCASIQEAIIDQLAGKIERAVKAHGCKQIAIVGGVAANSRLRGRLEENWKRIGCTLPPLYPQLKYCTDNAAMIAAAGAFRYHQGHFLQGDARLTLNALAYPES